MITANIRALLCAESFAHLSVEQISCRIIRSLVAVQNNGKTAFRIRHGNRPGMRVDAVLEMVGDQHNDIAQKQFLHPADQFHPGLLSAVLL